MINQKALSELLGANSFEQCQRIHKDWVEDELRSKQLYRDTAWSQNIAVGHKDYVENIKMTLGVTGRLKTVLEDEDVYSLKEPVMPYTTHFEHEMSVLSGNNTILLE